MIDKELRKSPYEVKEVGSGDVSLLLTDGHHGSPTYVDRGIPYLRVTNIAPFGIKSNELKLISEAQSRQLGKRCHVKTGDVLVSIVGTIGVATVVTQSQDGFAFSRDLARIVPTKNVNPQFLAAFFNSELGKSQMQRRTTGAVQKGVYLKSLRSIKIPLPPRKVQDRIALIIEAARARSQMLKKEAEQTVEEAEKQIKEIIEGKKAESCKTYS
jgi:restriction endonuclease S subunit